MPDLWPWLAVAGAGAVHGMSPANGWMLAAACGVHARDAAQARRALRPIALGQLASMAVLAWTFSRGLSFDRALMRDLAAALLVAATMYALSSRSASRELAMPSSLALALTTVGVHMAAMLLTTGLLATGVCRGVDVLSTLSRVARRVGRSKPALASATRASCCGNVAQSQRIQSSERNAELP